MLFLTVACTNIIASYFNIFYSFKLLSEGTYFLGRQNTRRFAPQKTEQSPVFYNQYEVQHQKWTYIMSKEHHFQTYLLFFLKIKLQLEQKYFFFYVFVHVLLLIGLLYSDHWCAPSYYINMGNWHWKQFLQSIYPYLSYINSTKECKRAE